MTRPPVSRGELFAFYGILRDDPALTLSGTYVGDCLVHGEMWTNGAFPALVEQSKGPRSTVKASLWLPPADDWERALAVRSLDALEGYTGDPATSMYVRRRRPLAEPAHRSAWVYVWARGTGGLDPVPHGDWWRERTSARRAPGYGWDDDYGYEWE